MKHLRSLLHQLRLVYSWAFSGVAAVFFLKQQWIYGSLLVVAFLAFSFDTSKVLLRLGARGYSGLSIVIPVAPLNGDAFDRQTAQRHAAIGVKALRETVKRCRKLELLLASGFRVIGWERHPGWLYSPIEELCRAHGPGIELSVAMLDPASPAGERRAENVMPGYPFSNYEAGTRATLSTLRRWREQFGARVEVHYYTDDPIWQMIRPSDELWLMCAADNATDYSPFFVFRRDKPYGLIWGLDAVWNRRWDATTVSVDLDAVTTPELHEIAEVQGIRWE